MKDQIKTTSFGILVCLVIIYLSAVEARELSRSIQTEFEALSLEEHVLAADKCTGVKCLNGGKCYIKDGKGLCKCTDRYAGDKCQTDKCSSAKCVNGGKCYIKDGKALCKCTERYTGDKCQTDKCKSIKCQNGGTCYIKTGKALCKCTTERFVGDNCQTDKCSRIKCLNGGNCLVKDGKVLCKCPKDYTGTACQTVVGTTMTTMVPAVTSEGITPKIDSTTNPPSTTVKELPSTPEPEPSTVAPSTETEKQTTVSTTESSTRATTTSPNLELIKSLVVKILIYEKKI